MFIKKLYTSAGKWWYIPLIPALWRWISVSWRPAWSTERVPGQDPKLQRNPVQGEKNEVIYCHTAP